MNIDINVIVNIYYSVLGIISARPQGLMCTPIVEGNHYHTLLHKVVNDSKRNQESLSKPW